MLKSKIVSALLHILIGMTKRVLPVLKENIGTLTINNA